MSKNTKTGANTPKKNATDTPRTDAIKLAAKAARQLEQDKLIEINRKREEIAAFLARRTAKTEVYKVAAETKKNASTRKLGKEDYILLAIYNAGYNGIRFSELVKIGKNRIEPVTAMATWKNEDGKEMSAAVAEVTVSHNWNVKDAEAQRGELKLRDPEALDTETSKTTRKSIGDVYFTSDDTGLIVEGSVRKNNNLITLVIGQEDVKKFLLHQGAKPEQLTFGNELAATEAADTES